jgi:putative transposase
MEIYFMEHTTTSDELFFITFTTIDWIDLFTRIEYKQLLVDQLNHCIKHKGIEIYSYVIMTNHIHLIARSSENKNLSDFIRDFKSYTTKELYKCILKNNKESRKEWLLNCFRNEKINSNRPSIQIWQNGSHPLKIYSTKFLKQKSDYIHKNPVRAGIVDEEWKYLYSSASPNCLVKIAM